MKWNKGDLKRRYEELKKLLADPVIATDPSKQRLYNREFKGLNEAIVKIELYEKLMLEYKETEELLEDPELKPAALEELKRLKESIDNLKLEIEGHFASGYEDKGCIVEIRAGTGGDEAGLFARDLFRMYTKFLEKKKINYELLSSHDTGIGGFKEVVFSAGVGSFALLRLESGVHRVQRIPVTETGGRIHTSTATVAVLPEVEEVDLKIDPNELKIDTFRASGHGGQHVNVTDSAVRITHISTGITVTCQDERSQHKNRTKAMKILRARLSAFLKEKKDKEIGELRKSQVGTGERSEKIRTYNFPQNRVTDHRINFSLYKLQEILDGNLDSIIKELLKDED